MGRPVPTPRFVLRSVAVGVAAALALGLVGAGSASAQSIDDLRARARGIADQLDQLVEEQQRLDQDLLETQERMAEVNDQIAETRAAMADAEARMQQASKRAGDYAVTAYIRAGADTEHVVGASDVNAAVNQRVLLDTLRGDQEQVSDDLRAARLDLDDKAAELDRANAELAATRDQQQQVHERLDSSVARQQQLLNGANAQLQQAIQAEQARRRAEEEARARAALQAAAARAAAQRAAAQQAAAQAAPRGGRAATTRVATSRGRAPVPAAAVAPVSAGGNSAIAAAMAKLGTPYRFGGTGNGGYDCSGLTQAAFAAAGKSLPRTARQQYAATQRVSDPQPGDLMFWGGANASHVAIYLGDGKMVAAPHTGTVVQVQSVYGNPTYGRVG